MPPDVDIEGFLHDEGFVAPESALRARALLEEHKLTRPGKQRMVETKLARARELFAAGFVKACSKEQCGRLAPVVAAANGREVVAVAATACELCGGSNNRRAALDLAERLRSRGATRLAVVGGTPTQHAELRGLLANEGLDLRCVDATKGSHTLKDAAQVVKWAQVLVIWAPTPLPHKVSNVYKDAATTAGVRAVMVHQRGIEAICREVLRSFE